MAKMIYRKDTGEILGVHIIGLHAADLIHEASNAVATKQSVQVGTGPWPRFNVPLLQASSSAQGHCEGDWYFMDAATSLLLKILTRMAMARRTSSSTCTRTPRSQRCWTSSSRQPMSMLRRLARYASLMSRVYHSLHIPGLACWSLYLYGHEGMTCKAERVGALAGGGIRREGQDSSHCVATTER